MTASNILKWILDIKDNRFFEVQSSPTEFQIKQVVHANIPKDWIEILVVELINDDYAIPAIFEPDAIRTQLSVPDLNKEHFKELKDKVVEISKHMIGVCCVNNKVYPYLIILEFNYEPKAVERPFRNAQCVYKNDEIKEWIDNLNRSVQHLDRPLSTYFKSRELGKKYPTFKQIEPMLEFILSKLYENLNNDSTTVTKQSVNQPYSTTELSVGKDEMRRTKDERKRTQTENLIKKDVKHASVTLHEKQGSQTKVAPKQKTNKRSIMDDIFANYDYKPKKRKEINASISQQSVADKKDVSNEAERTSRQQLGKKNEPELSKPNTEAASHSENTIKSTIPKCIHLISAKEYQKTVEARFNAMTIIPDEECIIPSSQISITKTSVENNLTTTLNSSNTTTNHIHSGKQIKRFLSDNDLRIEEYRLSSLLDVLSDFNIEYEKIIIESNPYKKRKHFSKLRTVNALLHF